MEKMKPCPDAKYFIGDDGKPLAIGAGDVLAIHGDLPETVQEAYALGWNECRILSTLQPAPAGVTGEPELTCPHIDRLLAMGCLTPEARAELATIRDINSQLRFGLWSEKARANDAEASPSPDASLREALDRCLTFVAAEAERRGETDAEYDAAEQAQPLLSEIGRVRTLKGGE